MKKFSIKTQFGMLWAGKPLDGSIYNSICIYLTNNYGETAILAEVAE